MVHVLLRAIGNKRWIWTCDLEIHFVSFVHEI